MTRLTLIIPALVALLVSGLAGSSYAENGDNGERLPNFKQLCIADGSTGFNWENGGWIRTYFIPEKYIIAKISVPQSQQEMESDDEILAYSYCRAQMAEPEIETERWLVYNACVRIQQLGSDVYDFMGCTEQHRKSGGEKGWRVQFVCDDLYFTPNGHFHKAVIHGHLETEPKDDYKDSLSISVGKCADISN